MQQRSKANDAALVHDNVYTLNGTTWRREWIGDNSGRYDWTSEDARLVCWREGHIYRATLDGYPSTRTWPTLTGAMAATATARAAYDRRRSHLD
jgi:hypothetical protein